MDALDLKNPNTMIVATDQEECSYMEGWCNLHGIMPGWVGGRSKYPIALSPNGFGWTGHMDRILDYFPFTEFLALVKNKEIK